MDCSSGCLFDVVADPEERHDLAAEVPALARDLRERLALAKRGYFQNHDVGIDTCPAGWKPGWWGRDCACWMAAHVHGDNTSGPWLGPYQ
eukprot:gene14394-15969_t